MRGQWPTRSPGGKSSREARRITQFLDRDTRPDFAGASAMQTFLLDFLKNPKQDLAALEDTIQRFWDSLPDYQG